LGELLPPGAWTRSPHGCRDCCRGKTARKIGAPAPTAPTPAGYSDIIFALFDLLGLQFAPRLAGLADTRLWYLGAAHDSPAGGLLRHRVKLSLIHDQWEELVRLAGSLNNETVTARRLHAQQRRSRLAAALQDYGRLAKTEFHPALPHALARAPRYHRQLNKHESINASKTPSSMATTVASVCTRWTAREQPGRGPRARVSSDRHLEHTTHETRSSSGERAPDRLLTDIPWRLSPAIHAHINLNGPLPTSTPRGAPAPGAGARWVATYK